MGSMDDNTLRKYLLGELNEEEQSEVEQRLLAEGDFFEQVLIEEDELIDDYLDGSLSGAQRHYFDQYFLCTPERQKKYLLIKGLRRKVGAMASVQPKEPVTALASKQRRWKMVYSPAFRIAAAILIAAVIIFL